MPSTKIVATIGPASSNPDMIRRMLDAGMTVARVNFSHGNHEAHTEVVTMLRRVAAAEEKVLALLGDLQGPKLRLGHVRAGGIQLSLRDEVTLTPYPGQPAMIDFPHPELMAVLQPGARLVIGDGEVEFTVVEGKSDLLRCQVTVAGLLESRKGVNVPGTDLPVSSITEKDRKDLELICQLDFDYVALSFVRSPQDVHELRDLMASHNKQIPVIAKIEKAEAIEHLKAIRDVADGLMVARGDLGIDMTPQEVPLLQKEIIRFANQVGKPVITATQMLQSMVQHPQPTRAEASDVANAILDGTDAVMLSGETATGRFPVEAVQMMRQIAEMTERAFDYDLWRERRHIGGGKEKDLDVTGAISAASCDIAEAVGARMIISGTISGFTAQQIARHRPRFPILALSPSVRTQRRLALVWGVNCQVTADFRDTHEMIAMMATAVRPYGLQSGDKIVITAGVPLGTSGQTNLIRVHEIE